MEHDTRHLSGQLQVRATSNEQLRHFLCRLKTIVRFLGEKLVDNHHQPVREFRHNLLQGSGGIIDDSFQYGNGRGSSKRRPTARHLIQHAAKAEEIGSMIQRLAHRLFGSHVHRRSGDHARSSQTGVVGGSCQSEVGDFHFLLNVAFDQNIARLNVAMDQAQSMSRCKSTGDLLAKVQNLSHIQWTISVQLLL